MECVLTVALLCVKRKWDTMKDMEGSYIKEYEKIKKEFLSPPPKGCRVKFHLDFEDEKPIAVLIFNFGEKTNLQNKYDLIQNHIENMELEKERIRLREYKEG